MKLGNILIFALVLLLAGIALLFSFPPEGIPVGNGAKFYLPSLSEVVSTTEDPAKQIEVADLLEEEVAPDTVVVDPRVQARLDSIRNARMADSLRKWQLSLHYPNNDKSILYPFFKSLKNAQNKPIRILHYGDSQMESDRITGYIRSKLQSRFGGSGPGLLAAIPICPTPLAMYHYSDNWERFKGFGYRDKRVKHKEYGPAICFGKVTSGFKQDTSSTDSTVNDSLFEAELILRKQSIASRNVRDWHVFKMIYNNADTPFLLELYEDTSRVFVDYLFAEDINTFEWSIKNKNLNFLKIKISGKVSPEILGYSIEGKKGVWVDNISLRGSAGAIFRSVTRKSLTHFYDNYYIPLVIMQFGGNNMPYIEDKKACERYAQNMRRNMEYIKSMIPTAQIIMIGPSDMSVKEKTDWVTYPILKTCRNELRKATFEAGGVYWDLYEAMGGENSMPLWVEKRLAASDYIHFTVGGARKAASWFYDALMHDYEEWEKK